MSDRISTPSAKGLAMATGVLSLVSGVLVFIALLLAGDLSVFGHWAGTTIVALILALAGGVLCLLGKSRLGSVLVFFAFVIGELLGRMLFLAIVDSWLEKPSDGFVQFSNWSADFGPRFAWAWALIDFAFWTLLAASVLAMILFIKSFSSSASQTSGGSVVSDSQGNVPAGWYPDPDGKPVQRYWDGSAWTDQNRPAVGQPMASMPAARIGGAPQNGMGTAALTLGILGFFCFPLIASVLAIIFGKIGMTRADQGQATNRGAAKAGFILGIIGLVLGGIGLIFWIAAFASSPY